MSIYVLKDLSENEASRVVKLYKADGCSTKKTRQSNGKWKIEAECPHGVTEK